MRYFPKYDYVCEDFYATWLTPYYERGDIPNPCRKYHISSAIYCAHLVAKRVLPILREVYIHHKIVKDTSLLHRQTWGEDADQAGKFITVYMNPGVEPRNALLQEINVELQNAQDVWPGPMRPTMRLGRSESEETRVFETAVFSGPKGPFIFGGFLINPRE